MTRGLLGWQVPLAFLVAVAAAMHCDFAEAGDLGWARPPGELRPAIHFWKPLSPRADVTGTSDPAEITFAKSSSPAKIAWVAHFEPADPKLAQYDGLLDLSTPPRASVELGVAGRGQQDPRNVAVHQRTDETPNAVGEETGDRLGDNQEAPNTNWVPKPLDQIGTEIRLSSGKLPKDYAVERDGACWPVPPSRYRGWSRLNYCWAASCFAHWPLYFEEVNLERYGYGCHRCLQPFASGAHFFCRVPMLPYLIATDCPKECQYTLGHYRPGDCVPWRRHCVGWDPKGGFSQAGALTALVFILP